MLTNAIAVGNILVTKTKCYGGLVKYSAWELDIAHAHSTITYHDNGTRYGKVGTTRPVCNLPFGDERVRVVHAHYDADKARAYAAIREAFPTETAQGCSSDGEIQIWV